MDPYVAFEYNGKMFKTTVAKNAGLNATWNERFRLKPIVQPNELFLQCFAKKIITDTFIGETPSFKLNELAFDEKKEIELKIIDSKKRK